MWEVINEMAMRFCSICHADVEDVGGFCLLGHSLKVQPETASFTELRQEVDRSFEEARAKLAALVNGDDEPPPPPPQVHRTAPTRHPTPPRPIVVPPAARAHTPVSAPVAPASAPVHAPNPPSKGATPSNGGAGEWEGDSVSRVWRALKDNPAPGSEDPISAFSPPPRMDWGPSRFKFSRRR